MKQTVNFSMFRDAFFRCGRGEQFSYHALELLFDYLEEYEASCGEELELDPVAICCDYTEADPLEIAQIYDIEVDGVALENDTQDVLEFLEEATSVVGVTDSGTIVFYNY